LRKIQPTFVRDDFIAQISEIRNFYAAGLAGLIGDAQHSRLTEHMLIALAVSWEGFVSDMFIAYINRDPSQFTNHLRNSLIEHLATSSKPEAVFKNYGKLSFPKHFTKQDVQSLANSNGNNITYSSFARLKDGAKVLLAPAHLAQFNAISNPNQAMINALLALRNHIAHRSVRSSEAMNAALAIGALHTTGLKRSTNKVNNVGAWLKAQPPAKKESRMHLLLNQFEAIAKPFSN